VRPLDLEDESSEFFVQIVSGLGGLEASAVRLLPFVDLEEVVESHARETLAICPAGSGSVGSVGRDGDLSVKRGLSILEPNTGTSSLGLEFGFGSAGGADDFWGKMRQISLGCKVFKRFGVTCLVERNRQ
jgi:hypothetical protein